MPERPDWTFVTSHGVLLLEVSRRPDATVKELASRSGVTERQAHRVLGDLVEEGYVVRTRVGRKNHYRVNSEQPMRHPAIAAHRIGALLAALDAQ